MQAFLKGNGVLSAFPLTTDLWELVALRSNIFNLKKRAEGEGHTAKEGHPLQPPNYHHNPVPRSHESLLEQVLARALVVDLLSDDKGNGTAVFYYCELLKLYLCFPVFDAMRETLTRSMLGSIGWSCIIADRAYRV